MVRQANIGAKSRPIMYKTSFDDFASPNDEQTLVSFELLSNIDTIWLHTVRFALLNKPILKSDI